MSDIFSMALLLGACWASAYIGTLRLVVTGNLWWAVLFLPVPVAVWFMLLGGTRLASTCPANCSRRCSPSAPARSSPVY